MRAARIIRKTVLIFFAMQLALADFSLRMIFARRRLTPAERTRWLQRWCRRMLTWLAIEIDLYGDMPHNGLLVANHLSYLDIVVFGALAPAVFVAKMEVRGWTLIGRFAKLAGVIFLDRWKLRAWPDVLDNVEAALRAGELVIAFPEATTTDGGELLPFRPAMFEAAVRCRSPITAAHIWYTLEDGSFGRSLCWFGKVQGAKHLAGTFSQRRIRATVNVTPSRVFVDRKSAARQTFDDVSRLQTAFRV